MKNVKSIKIILLASLLIIALVVSLSFTVGITFAKSADFKHGEGTESNPFIISTPSELNMVRYHRDAYFLQTANLDMSDFGQFAPIGSVTFPFTGHYNGGKYSITNMTIDSDDNNVGLFSVIYNGTVENLKIIDSNITGAYNVGAIAGTNKGILQGCVVNSKISGIGAVGGISGLNSTRGMIMECGNLGVIENESGKYFGGISGINDGIIENCYNHGDISINSNDSVYSGGLVGYNNGGQNAEINTSYSIGLLGGKARGQIAGDNNGKINDCYFEENNFNLVSSFNNGQIVRTKSLIKDDFIKAESFVGWNDFNDIWMYIDNCDYPLLSCEYVAVESVEFSDKNTVELMPGESYAFEAVVKPVHATVQNISYEVLDDNDVAEFDSVTNTIIIKESAEIDSVISVKAIAEGHASELYIKVIKIPVTHIEISSVTGRTSVSASSSLSFKTNVFPSSASFKDVKYSANSSYATITEDGTLTVRDNAPLGATILVTVTSKENGNIYDSIMVTVVAEPIQSVIINSADKFKVTESLLLTATINPANATNKNVTFEIVSTTAKGARLIGNILYAEGLGEIIVKAMADGVSSEEFKVNVTKEPVAEVVFNIPNNIICGEGLPLYADALPYNATYREVSYEIITNNANAEIIDGVLYAKRHGIVVVRAMADGVFTDKTITVNKVPVESIMFNCADSFKHTESLSLNVKVKPNNATYPDITYRLIDNTAGARVANGILLADKPGSVTVWAKADGISTSKTIIVNKEAVSNIVVTADYVEDERGEALQFNTVIYPKNATYQDVSFVLKNGPAKLSKDGYLLIDINAPIGSLIEVYAEADGIKSAVYEVRAGKISVESVTLESDLNVIRIGQGAKLTVLTNPVLVSNPGVTYFTSDGVEVIDGILYVHNTDLVGQTVSVTAIVDCVLSNTITIYIEKTPVQAVGFTCGTNFKVTENLALTTKVYPIDATYPTVTYSIISDGNTGASIIDGYLYAERPGVLKIRACADGVSRDLIVHALKEPVADIVLTSVKSIKVNQELLLASIVYPHNATYKLVRYELIDNAIGAEIWDGNIFYSEHAGLVKIRVFADDMYRDFEIEVMKEPVVDIKMPGAKSFKHTERLKLSAYVIPFNATYNNISYEIISGDDFAYISENYLYASRPGMVSLKLSADGFSVVYDIEVIKNAVTGVEFTGESSFALTKGYRQGEIELNSTVYPYNATYPSIEYEIVSSYNCDAVISDGKLRVNSLKSIETDSNGYAIIEQGTVIVRATADGVYTERTFVVCKNEVDNISITRELQISPLTNSAWNYTESKEYKTSGIMRFSVDVLSEYATYKEFIVKVDGKELIADKNDGMYHVSADNPCTKTVTITSLCNGNSWKFDFIINEELVDKVYLGTEVTYDADNYKKIIKIERGKIEPSANSSSNDVQDYIDYALLEVQQASQISIRPFARAANPDLKATYGNMIYLDLYYEIDGISRKFVDGEDNQYFKYDGNLVTIKVNAPVKKSFYLFAKSQYGAVVSDKTQVLIQSRYITEIKEAYIDTNGLIRGLDGLYESNTNTSDIVKIDVSIKHTSGIIIEKSIVTKDPTMRLQLYNPTLGGNFTLSYTLYFEENDNSYNYTLERVKSFAGLKEGAYIQNAESNYNTIVLFDFYSGNPKQTISIKSNVKAVYMYGSGSKQNVVVDITTNSSNTTDLYLDNIYFVAPANLHAMTIVDNGTLNLYTKATVIICGGNGSGFSASGKNAIYTSSASLNVFNEGNLKLSGGNGYIGESGYSYSRNVDVGSGAGTAPSGGDGKSGGSGGTGIQVKNLIIKENYNTITINGGKGANGGNGGNGSGSDRDGRPNAGKGGNGGQGGNGGNAIDVKGIAQINLNANSIFINGGDAGAGGEAGHGGHGLKEHYSDNGGAGGTGGSGGNGGSGITATTVTGNLSSKNVNIKTGKGGAGRNGGSGGNGCDSWGKSQNGRGGSGGNSGSSGNGIKISFQSIDLSVLNNCITLGEVYEGGSIGSNGNGNANAAVGSRYNGNKGQIGKKIA